LLVNDCVNLNADLVISKRFPQLSWLN